MQDSSPADLNPKDAAALRDSKPTLDLLEYVANVEIAKAMKHGADKYGKGNFRTIPIYASTYVAAIERHIGAWGTGEDLDQDSGLHHLAHIGANVHVLYAAMDAGTLVDDRGPATRDELQELASRRSNGQHSGMIKLGADPLVRTQPNGSEADEIPARHDAGPGQRCWCGDPHCTKGAEVS